jgi:transposase
MLRLVNASLAGLDGSFDGLYARTGRPSIAPERLLRAVLLQMLYSIRSERQLMERLEFDLLFRWFVGLGIDDAVWHPTAFRHNRDRVLTTEVAQGFLSALLAQAAVKKLLSAEHFSVDGTMLKAFASMNSFRAKDGPGGDDVQKSHPSSRLQQRNQNFSSLLGRDKTFRIAAARIACTVPHCPRTGGNA